MKYFGVLENEPIASGDRIRGSDRKNPKKALIVVNTRLVGKKVSEILEDFPERDKDQFCVVREFSTKGVSDALITAKVDATVEKLLSSVVLTGTFTQEG